MSDLRDDIRLIPPERRYEGPLLRLLGRVASIGMFGVYLAIIAFIVLKLVG